MPLPKKRPTETRDEFMKRCISDSVMIKEFPEIKQRTAVCAYRSGKQ